MRQTVTVSKGKIGEYPVLFIHFHFHSDLVDIARRLGAIWSSERRLWHLPFSRAKLEEAQLAFGRVANFVYRGYRNNPPRQSAGIGRGKPSKRFRRIGAEKLSPKSKKLLHGYVKYLRGKVLSESTVRTYYIHILDFLIYLSDKPAEQVCNRDVELFVENVCLKRKYSVSTHRQVISAIKQFVKFQPSQIENPKLERPKKTRFLPAVLSKQEVVELLRNTRNMKHRAALALLYSSGLRIGEMINLELQDIDIDRRQIFVRNGKGRKDRYVIMAESFAQLLSNYLITYNPSKYFIEGTKPGTQYAATSVRAFLRRSVQRAGIRKKVTPHTLRHSYATHLLEQGVDVRYIQELLGHSRPETTMIYTHVTKKEMLQISSPLDTLVKQLSQPIAPNDIQPKNNLLSRDNN
jgi:site-specific recombinase XerD